MTPRPSRPRPTIVTHCTPFWSLTDLHHRATCPRVDVRVGLEGAR